MVFIFSYMDYVDLLLAEADILYLHWKDLSINLEDKIKIHEQMSKYIVTNKISTIASDFSTARGSFTSEIIEYSKDIVYPALARFGIKKFAIIIPINEKALKSYIDYSINANYNIKFMNFLLPSEALAWLSEG